MGWYNDAPTRIDPNSMSGLTQDGESLTAKDERLRRMAMQSEAMALANQEQSQQNQMAQQQRVGQWEADRSQMFHPYDTMPVERMATDIHSPLYTSPGKPQFQWANEPGPMPEVDMSRQPIAQPKWDAAMANTKYGSGMSHLSDTPESRNQRAVLDSLTEELKAVSQIPTPQNISRMQVLQGQISEIQKRMSPAAGQPGQGPAPRPTGGPLAGAVQGQFSPDQEQTIQDNMAEYGQPRERVIQALKAKGLL